MTKEERKALIHELTSNAGKARLVSMSSQERSRVAKLGAEARWERYRAEKAKREGESTVKTRKPTSTEAHQKAR